MRVWWSTTASTGRAALSGALPAPRFAVEQAARMDAVAAVTREVPEILLFGWHDPSDATILQSLKLADPHHFMRLVLVVDDERADRQIPLALAAGAHEFVRASAPASELRERLERTRRQHPRPTTPSAAPLDNPPVSESGTWRYLAHIVAEDLEPTIGRAMTIRALDGRPPSEGLQGSTITLSLVNDSSEVQLSLLVDRGSAAALSGLLLGDEGADAASQGDMLRELANVAAGAFKRFALLDHPVVTIGLPRDEVGLQPPTAHTNAWQLDWATDATLVVVAEARTRANAQLRAVELREGMVVVGDVRNGKGVLVVPGGTRLTTTTAERVATMLGNALVEISRAA